jgi:hypothetical protein
MTSGRISLEKLGRDNGGARIEEGVKGLPRVPGKVLAVGEGQNEVSAC